MDSIGGSCATISVPGALAFQLFEFVAFKPDAQLSRAMTGANLLATISFTEEALARYRADPAKFVSELDSALRHIPKQRGYTVYMGLTPARTCARAVELSYTAASASGALAEARWPAIDDMFL